MMSIDFCDLCIFYRLADAAARVAPDREAPPDGRDLGAAAAGGLRCARHVARCAQATAHAPRDGSVEL